MSTKPTPDLSLGNSSSNFSRNSEKFALENKQIFHLPKPAACSWNLSAGKILKGALVWPFRAKQTNSCVQVSLGWKNTPRYFCFDDRCFAVEKSMAFDNAPTRFNYSQDTFASPSLTDSVNKVVTSLRSVLTFACPLSIFRFFVVSPLDVHDLHLSISF